MKKILLFMAVLFASIGASAQEWELVKTADFKNGASIGWNGSPESVTFSTSAEDGLVVVNPEALDPAWSLQYQVVPSLGLESGKNYQVRVSLNASGEGTLNTKLGGWGGGATPAANFVAGDQVLTLNYEANDTDIDFLLFQHGGFVGTLKFSKVEIYQEKVAEDPNQVEIKVPVTGVTQTIKVYNNQFSNVAAPLTVVVPAQVSQSWDSQIWFTMSQPLASKAKISLSFDGKASVAKTLAANCHKSVDGNGWTSASAFSGAALTSEWNTFSYEFNAASGIHGFAADLTNGTNEPTYDFKNIKIGATVTVQKDQVNETLYNALAAQVNAAAEYISATRDELEAIKATAIKTKYVPQLEAEYDNLDGGVKQEIITLYDSNALTSENASKLEDAILAIVAKVAEIKAEATEATAAFYPVEEGDYLVMNAEGGYLGGANAWGTQASLLEHGQFFTLIQTENGYKLDSHVYNSATDHFLGSNCYVDNSGAEFTIAALDEENTLFTISCSEGYLSADEITKPLSFVKEMEGMAQIWALVPASKILADMELATAADPVDATALIKDANFSRNLYNKSFEPAWTVEASNSNLSGGANENCNAESWRSAFDVYQVIENIPNGLYILNAQAALTDYTNAYDGVDYPVVYANGASSPFVNMEGDDIGSSMSKMSAAFSAGKYAVAPVKVAVTDGTLRVGVKGTRTDTWAIWDNFELTYAGEAPALQQTNPANGGYVEAAPAKLMFMFNQEIAKADIEVANIAVEGQGDMEVAAENIEVIDGNTVVLTAEDLTALPSGSVVYAAVKIYGQSYDMSFTVMEALAVATSGVDEGEVWVKFNQNIDFAEGAAQTATLFAAGEGAEPIEVELTLDEEAFDVLVATLPADIKAGNYTLQIAAATVMSTVTEMTNEELSIDVEAEDGPAAGIAESIIEASEALAAVQEKITEDMTEATAEAEAIYNKLAEAYAAYETAETAEDYEAIKDSIAAVNEQIKALDASIVPALEDCDLTKEMFCQWDSYQANGNVLATGVGACDFGTSTGLPYGDGNVAGAFYADLTGYAVLALTVTEGTPRLLLNRQGMDNSGDFIEIKSADSEYVLGVVDGVWYIDLAKITEAQGFAHLNCIKGANWANTTITEAKLLVEVPTAINGVAVTAAKNGKFLNNGKIVIVKNGKTYNVAGQIVK